MLSAEASEGDAALAADAVTGTALAADSVIGSALAAASDTGTAVRAVPCPLAYTLPA